MAEQKPMTASAPAAPHTQMTAEKSCKLRQSDAEYLSTRRNIQLHTGSARIYVCRRCQANFTVGGGVPKQNGRLGEVQRLLGLPPVIARGASC